MFNPNQAFLLVQKLKSAPKGLFLTLGVKAEIEKKSFQSAPSKLVINAEFLWPCIGPQAEKKERLPTNLGSQFATLGANVLAFSSTLGAKQQAKNAQSWPQVFFRSHS
jgi:hypothetical protein